jgi:hypothetical protein
MILATRCGNMTADFRLSFLPLKLQTLDLGSQLVEFMRFEVRFPHESTDGFHGEVGLTKTLCGQVWVLLPATTTKTKAQRWSDPTTS